MVFRRITPSPFLSVTSHDRISLPSNATTRPVSTWPSVTALPSAIGLSVSSPSIASAPPVLDNVQRRDHVAGGLQQLDLAAIHQTAERVERDVDRCLGT